MSILENRCLTSVNVYATVYDMENTTDENWVQQTDEDDQPMGWKGLAMIQHSIRGVGHVRASFVVVDGVVSECAL